MHISYQIIQRLTDAGALSDTPKAWTLHLWHNCACLPEMTFVLRKRPQLSAEDKARRKTHPHEHIQPTIPGCTFARYATEDDAEEAAFQFRKAVADIQRRDNLPPIEPILIVASCRVADDPAIKWAIYFDAAYDPFRRPKT